MTGRAPVPGLPDTGVVLELCGLPGSGKTTLARQLVERLTVDWHVQAVVVDQDVSASTALPGRLARRARMALLACAACPGQQLHAVRLLTSGQHTLRDRVAVPIQWCATRQLVARSTSRSGVIVLEEGLLQTLWTAGLRSPTLTATALADLASAGSRPPLVVHLDVPVDLALDRLRARQSRHSRVQRLPAQEQAGQLRRGERLLDELVQEWQRRRLAEVLHVRVSEHDDPVASVLSHLRRRSRARPGTPSQSAPLA